MKILVFNWQDIRHPLGGGAEVHFHEIFSRIVRRGHAVTLYCSAFPGAAPAETIDGIRIIREGGRLLFNLRVPVAYLARFRHEGYDVVVDDFNKLPFFTPLYVRRPLAFIVHHLFRRSIFRETSFPVAALFYAAEWLGVAAARISGDPVMAVSPSTRDELAAEGIPGERIAIITNCVDHDIHSPDASVRSASPLVASFGRLKKYKSVDHLLRAFAVVVKSVPAARLVVIGDGDHRPALERLAADLGIAQSVTFTGFVDTAAKVRLLREAWFLVNTSAKEGWGLTVVEANACGTPVIASDVPGLRDATRDGETGLLFPYGDVDALASKMLLLLNDRPLREKLAAGALAWARTFDWNDAAEKTIALLERLIAGRRRA